MGDNLRLSQVLVNIISNALKFTPAGGIVTMEIKQTAVSAQEVSLEFIIADTGIGISEEFQTRIFEPFEQEKAATPRQYGGTGLGMAISYHFIKMMNGEIFLESKQNQGSKFTVKLTLQRPENQTAEKIPETGQKRFKDLTGIRILLAEDNEINAEIASVLLENNGAEVVKTLNGKEALETFASSQENGYSLILMDIQMPLMDGLEASRAIRRLKRPDAEKVLIIGLSANAFKEDIEKAMKSGMNGYLSKPVDPAKLLTYIEQFL